MAKTKTLDASNVAVRLWVGGVPPFDEDLPNFDVLVLTAREHQPQQVAFHGVTIRCGIPDGHLDHQEVARAVNGARATANSLVRGKRVLVTCAAGLNRSVFVAALALARLTRMTADQIIELMRDRRHPTALYNQHFCDLLRTFVRQRG